MPVPIKLSLLIFTIPFLILYYYAKYWRKKAAFALLLYGRNAQCREERKWAAKKALMAGHKDATKLYALACPEIFDKELPLQPFYREKIKCIFTDYYFSQRFHDWIAEDQWLFVRTVYLFKEGKDECGQYFAQAFKTLRPACDVTIMFMPCSSEARYYTRFSSLADFFLKFRGVQSGIDYITYLGERECKHTAQQRNEIDEISNYIINRKLKDHKVIIIDDLLTTGKSLSSYAKRLKESGAEVIGAIFLAKTFLLPTDRRIKWAIWKRFFLS